MKKSDLLIAIFLIVLGFTPQLKAQTITIGSGATTPSAARITVDGGTNKGTSLDCDGTLIMNGFLTLAGDAFLFIGGDFIRNANRLNEGRSTVIFDGTTPQAITRTASATSKFEETFYNIVIDNVAGVSLDNTQINTITLLNVLSPIQGTFATNGVLILRDVAGNNFARVAAGSGSIAGVVLVEKSLSPVTETTLGWRQLSRPVSGPSNTVWNSNEIKLLYNTYIPANRRNTFFWNSQASGTLDYAYGWQEAAPSSPETQALSVYMENNGFHDFSTSFSVSGVLNQGNFLFNLNYTRDPDDATSDTVAKGWNFIPNPWPALVHTGILLNDPINFTSTYKALHVWDATYENNGEVGRYTAILANGVSKFNYNTQGSNIDSTTQLIPPFQAFWVKATADNQVCNLIASTMQSTVIKGENFMKQEYPIVRLDVIDADSIADQLVIYFDESTSRQFDLVGDAYFLPSMRKDAPRFYALEGNSKASIVGRPVDVTDSVQVVFGSTKNQSKFYIHADLDELEEGWFVYLRDKKDNKTYALEDKKSLAFNHYGGLNSERFVVYYTKQANAFAHLVSGEDARILPFVHNNQLVLQSFGISGAAQINAFDAIGRLVYSENTNLDLGEERVLDFPPSEKLLFIQVNIGGNSFVEKVYY